MHEEIYREIEQGQLVITATQRLALYLTRGYETYQIQHQHFVFPSPSIYSLDHWLTALWHDLKDLQQTDPWMLLSDIQMKRLWQNILQKDTQDAFLFSEKTVDIAINAWTVLKQWNQSWEDTCFQSNEETRSFQRWAKQYHQTLLEKGWCDPPSLIDRISTAFEKNPRPLFKQIRWLGFDEITPQLQRFQSVLEKQGIVQLHSSFALSSKEINVFSFISQTDELQTMVQFCKDILQKNPTHHIACIVPHLPSQRHVIERAFTQAFAPESLSPNALLLQPIFTISAAASFQEFPLVFIALTLLKFLETPISTQELKHLLLSPYLGASQKEFESRSDLIQHFGNYGYEISIEELQNILTYLKKIHTPFLNKQLEQIRYLYQQHPSHQLPSQWAYTFSEMLYAIGWPGERLHDSAEYQLLERWKLLLQTFTSLDIFDATLTFSEALSTLQQLAKDTPFQYKSGSPQIHILGLLESGGLCFDAVWLMGMDDSTFPEKTHCNPFLPKTMAESCDMPHSNTQREWRIAKQITDRILQSAPHITISYTSCLEEEVRNISPLFQSFPYTPIASKNELSYSSIPKASLEKIHDTKAPVFASTETTKGSSLFRLQAACPFRAYAEIRLKALAPSTPSFGFDGKNKGILIHAALKKIWHSLKSQTALRALSLEQLQLLLKKTISETFLEFQRQSLKKIPSHLFDLEKIRLESLLLKWLLHEKERPPFYVLETERWQTSELFGIPLKLVIDRIDKTEEGDWIILDYKTGSVHLQDWFGDRPDDLQLPLYAITQTEAISGILFANIRGNRCEFKGITAYPSHIPGAESAEKFAKGSQIPWDTLTGFWKTSLKQLAEAFKNGEASVDPKYGEETCRYCHLRTLCRVDEINAKLCNEDIPI